jgi:hypothetical protein
MEAAAAAAAAAATVVVGVVDNVSGAHHMTSFSCMILYTAVAPVFSSPSRASALAHHHHLSSSSRRLTMIIIIQKLVCRIQPLVSFQAEQDRASCDFRIICIHLSNNGDSYSHETMTRQLHLQSSN